MPQLNLGVTLECQRMKPNQMKSVNKQLMCFIERAKKELPLEMESTGGTGGACSSGSGNKRPPSPQDAEPKKAAKK